MELVPFDFYSIQTIDSHKIFKAASVTTFRAMPNPIQSQCGAHTFFSSQPGTPLARPPSPALPSSAQSTAMPEHSAHQPAISKQLQTEWENTPANPVLSSPAHSHTREKMETTLKNNFEEAWQGFNKEASTYLKNLPDKIGKLASRARFKEIYDEEAGHLAGILEEKMNQAFDISDTTLLKTLPSDIQEEEYENIQMACYKQQGYQQKFVDALPVLFAEAGWEPTDRGNWEADSPLLIRHQIETTPLTLEKANLHAGEQGAISKFANKRGFPFAAKIITGMHSGSQTDLLGAEFKGYKQVYDSAGVHPNLMNVYGLRKLQMEGKLCRVLLMDYVQGPNGEAVFTGLRHARSNGAISNEQFWTAIKFVASRLLNVAAHLEAAGIVHNDIKPANVVFSDKGEPILGDLGLWSATKTAAPGYTAMFGPPEAQDEVDARSDVFAIGATLVAAVEGSRLFLEGKDSATRLYANRSVALEALQGTRSDGIIPLHPATADNAPYNQFVAALLNQDKDKRPTPEKALALDFLKDDVGTNVEMPQREEEARTIILKAIELSKQPPLVR